MFRKQKIREYHLVEQVPEVLAPREIIDRHAVVENILLRLDEHLRVAIADGVASERRNLVGKHIKCE